MEDTGDQAEFFGLIWQPPEHPFRLRANDLIRFDGRLGLVLRVNESSAVILMNRPPRVFITRFDKPVRFQPRPFTFHISPDSEIEILNRTTGKPHKQKPVDPPRARSAKTKGKIA